MTSEKNPIHQSLLAELKKAARKDLDQDFFRKYHGTPRFCYGVPVPVKRKIVKEFFSAHRDLSETDFFNLLDLLYASESFDERTVAAELFLLFPEFRKKTSFQKLESWLEFLEGWAEVDTTCQSAFGPEEMLKKWPAWEKFLSELSRSKNINVRRASLVFLTRPTRESNDERLQKMAFLLIDRLKLERDILITKAVSWLLRSLVTHHKAQVAEYITAHREELPKIAVRETLNKIRTGKK